MAGQGSPAAGAIRHHLVALINQILVPDLPQGPPDRFDIVILIGDIGVVHIGPKTDPFRHLLPFTLIFPDRFFAFLDKGFHTKGLDLFLAIQTQPFFDFQFDRKPMGIPAGLAGDIVALHGPVAGDQVLDDPGQDMAGMGHAIGGGRTVIEGINGRSFPLLHGLAKDILLLPKLQDGFFSGDKIETAVYFFIHAWCSPCRRLASDLGRDEDQGLQTDQYPNDYRVSPRFMSMIRGGSNACQDCIVDRYKGTFNRSVHDKFTYKC